LDVYPPTEAMFSYVNYLADINISYFAVGTSLGDVGSIGFDLKTFDFGDIPVTTETFPDGTGETYSPSFLHLVYIFKSLTDRISIGTNLKLITEYSNTSKGFALMPVFMRFSEALMIGAVKNIEVILPGGSFFKNCYQDRFPVFHQKLRGYNRRISDPKLFPVKHDICT
jgi:hypothetical protein